MTYDVVNPGPGLGQAQKGGGVKSFNRIPPPTLDLNSDDNKINNNLSPLNVNAHKINNNLSPLNVNAYKNNNNLSPLNVNAHKNN
jgi:hypothetical protein